MRLSFKGTERWRWRRASVPAVAGLLLFSPAMPLPAAFSGPDFRPPFEAKQSKRLVPELVVRTFLDSANRNQPAEAAALVTGNKRIAVHET